MSRSGGPAEAELPIDPTFPPSAYFRMATMLRTGVLGFLALAAVGMVARMIATPGLTVASVLATDPAAAYGSASKFLGALANAQPEAIVILGIFVMIAVTIGRVVLATIDFYRWGERVLGTGSLAVVLLLLLGLLVVAPIVA